MSRPNTTQTPHVPSRKLKVTGNMDEQLEEFMRETGATGIFTAKYEAARFAARTKIEKYNIVHFAYPDPSLNVGAATGNACGSVVANGAIATDQGTDAAGAVAGTNELFGNVAAAPDQGMKPAFPVDVMIEIIKHAMTANNGGKIVMSCLTNRGFAPNIAVGLLRVNHETYHEASVALFVHNQFIFDHFGSDLQTFDKPFMMSSCRPEDCPLASQTPYMKSVRFELGCEVDAEMGKISIENFTNALKRLRRPITVEKLTIHFHTHSYNTSAELGAFTMALVSKIVVLRVLTLTGPFTKHHDNASLELADSFDMMPYPTWAFSLRPPPAPFGDRGFSYARFKTYRAIKDYDEYESQLIMEAAKKGAYLKGFEMHV